MAYRDRPSSPLADNTTQRKPYHYGGLALGSVNSHTGDSRPSSPHHARSSMYSQHGGQGSPEPPTTPQSPSQSVRNRSSTRLSFTQSGAPTPPLFASTAISPGHSVPSSRPSTPGHFPTSSGSQSAGLPPGACAGVPPSAFAYSRQSWPRYADDESDGSGPAFGGMVRERRPSRLSLTLSTWEGSGEREEAGAGPSRKSTTGSLGGDGAMARSASVSTNAHVHNSEGHGTAESTLARIG